MRGKPGLAQFLAVARQLDGFATFAFEDLEAVLRGEGNGNRTGTVPVTLFAPN